MALASGHRQPPHGLAKTTGDFCVALVPASHASHLCQVGAVSVKRLPIAGSPHEALLCSARLLEALQPLGGLGRVRRDAHALDAHVRQMVHAHGHALVGSGAEQLDGLGVVGEHALAVAVQARQVVHGPGVAQVCGGTIELGRLSKVLRHALAVAIQGRQVGHGQRVAPLQRGGAQRPERLWVALHGRHRQPAHGQVLVRNEAVVRVLVAAGPVEALVGGARLLEALLPLGGLGHVLRHAQPVHVHVRQMLHARGHALVRSGAEQLDGLGVVAGHALAVAVQACEVVHGPGVALVRSNAEQLGGLGVVLGEALAVVVERAKVVERSHVAALARRTVQARGLGVVLSDAVAVLVQAAQVVHGAHVAALHRSTVHLHGLGVVLRHALAVVVHEAHPRQGRRVAQIHGLREEGERLLVLPLLMQHLALLHQRLGLAHALRGSRLGQEPRKRHGGFCCACGAQRGAGG